MRFVPHKTIKIHPSTVNQPFPASEHKIQIIHT